MGQLLEPWCPEWAYKVEVKGAWCVVPLEVAVRRPASVGGVLGYVKKVGGFTRVMRKAASRLVGMDGEHKVVMAGFGVVTSAPEHGACDVGEEVVFVAPRQDMLDGVVVVSPYLLVCCADVGVVRPRMASHTRVLISACSSPEFKRLVLEEIAGWSVHAGWALDASACREVMGGVIEALPQGKYGAAVGHDGVGHMLKRVARQPPHTSPSKVVQKDDVVVFGYGHYMRTCVMPHLRAHFRVQRVHEIDPRIIGVVTPEEASLWSTSPAPEAGDERAALWCVAGYHHHHSELACEALEHGVDVLVEKPLVVQEQQLDEVLAAMRLERGRLYQGFHRRSWQVACWLQEDLDVQRGESVVHMHSVVHEVRLPPHHWYRWESSGSRRVVNGCHWIDEFMYWNGYPEWRHASAQSFQGGEVVMVQVELENGATLSLTLSSVGSDRLGVRECTQWSVGERMARLVDHVYESECFEGQIRANKRVLEEETYTRLIARVVGQRSAGEGERMRDVERLWRLVFELQSELS